MLMPQLTTKEAIAARRSIRRFKPDPVSDEHIAELLDAARLAPSGSNAQPWRFKIVKDAPTRALLMAAANNQKFIGAAPVVLVCCVDIQGYVAGTLATVEALSAAGGLPADMAVSIRRRTEELAAGPRDLAAARIAFNIGIAGEHIALRALDEQRVRELFGWSENIYVAALLPIGYPAEAPPPRPRRPLSEMILP